MKSVEFSEEQLANLNDIAQQLFADEENPESYGYIRKLNRPKIHWLKILLLMFSIIVVTITSFYTTYFFYKSTLLSSATSGIILLLLILISAKKIIIHLIMIYQRYAPTSIREKCRFEPSCSEYMLLAIEKYGLIKGVKKGINRLKRCNINNGGYDYP